MDRTETHTETRNQDRKVANNHGGRQVTLRKLLLAEIDNYGRPPSLPKPNAKLCTPGSAASPAVFERERGGPAAGQREAPTPAKRGGGRAYTPDDGTMAVVF
jgi:hypothetical protein